MLRRKNEFQIYFFLPAKKWKSRVENFLSTNSSSTSVIFCVNDDFDVETGCRWLMWIQWGKIKFFSLHRYIVATVHRLGPQWRCTGTIDSNTHTQGTSLAIQIVYSNQVFKCCFTSLFEFGSFAFRNPHRVSCFDVCHTRTNVWKCFSVILFMHVRSTMWQAHPTNGNKGEN